MTRQSARVAGAVQGAPAQAGRAARCVTNY